MKSFLRFWTKATRGETGIAVVDLITAFLVVSVMAGTAISQFRSINDSSEFAADGIVAYLREARAKALTGTIAYTVSATSTTQIRAQYSALCSTATKTTDTSLSMKLPNGTTMGSSNWSVCFDSRGFANGSVQVTLSDSLGRTSTIEVVLGGGVRKL